MLEALKLPPPIFQFPFLGIDDVVVPRAGKHRDFHPGLDARLELDVVVQRQVRPEVDHLDGGIAAADAVDAPEPLDDADGIPVDVVVNQIVAVLQVLPLGDAVGCNEHVDFAGILRA